MRSLSSKHGGEKENKRGISGRMLTLHQRLYNALNLGFREHEWYCSDMEIQRLVIRSIDAFLDCVSSETLELPIVKNSIADMIEALKGILQLNNESTLGLASAVALKLISIIPSWTLQLYVLDLICPLSSLLSSGQLEVSISCASAMSLILSNLSSKREREAWNILQGTKAVTKIIDNIKDFNSGVKPTEYFQLMASLLSKMLWRWPSSRCSVWSDNKLMEVLDFNSCKLDLTIKIPIIQLYSSIALCGNGAMKLLENGESILYMMVDCMSNSNFHSLQMEAFKLAQCFVMSEQCCLKVLQLCSEPLVKAIISAMSNQSLHSGKKLSKDQLSVLVEACRLAMITRWPGEHHNCFWKLGVDRALFYLLEDSIPTAHQSQQVVSLNERMVSTREGLRGNFLLLPYLWDILGWLAAHCKEDLNPKTQGNERYLNNLIGWACLVFVDSIRAPQQIWQTYAEIEPVSRTVLMMIYSPCKYISSRARCVLSETAKQNGMDDLLAYILSILNTVNDKSPGSKFSMVNNLQLVVYLMGLACCSGLPEYRKFIIESQGIKTLLAFFSCWLCNPLRVKRLTVAPHLQCLPNERSCCHNFADWEGEDILLLFELWSLAGLIQHFGSVENHEDLFVGQVDSCETQFVSELQKICIENYAPGPRWYAAYILSYFGFYGFPSRLGLRFGKALNAKETTDFKLVFANQEHLSAHGVVLMVRCPSLLSRGSLPLTKKTSAAYLGHPEVKTQHMPAIEVRLSAHVDSQALLKLLEFVYFGYLQTGNDLLKKLKLLSKHCELQPLLQMLRQRSPKWGNPFPSFNLTLALGPAGYTFSDIILEANATELVQWKCCFCSVLVPHIHAHKIFLSASCHHLKAMFQSGMQESQSQTIKVPVSWEALVQLVDWFYSGEMPRPLSGCLWDNLDDDAKLRELKPYVELCWLTDFWLLEDVHEECIELVISFLDSARYLSTNILKLAANFSQWKLADVAASYMAPLYNQLRNSGELDALDEELVEMVRTAAVQLSRRGNIFRS